MIHADNAVSWHNQDIEHKHEEYYCSASCGGISHLKKICFTPTSDRKKMSSKKVEKWFH